MRRGMVALVLASACARPATSKPPAPPAQSSVTFHQALRAAGVYASAHSISGRVVLDGMPVTTFTVTVTPNADFIMAPFEPRVVVSPDGRFTVPTFGNQRVDLVIAGEGFARHVVQNVPLSPVRSLDLGVIELSRGRTYKGIVRDTTGAVVPDAKVSFRPGVSRAATPVIARALGHRETTTDARGAFRIVEVELYRPGTTPRLIASAPGLVSFELPTLGSSDPVELVVHPAGSVELNTATTKFAVLRPARQRQPFFFLRPGERRDDIPAGDYDVVTRRHLDGPYPTVTIRRGELTVVELP